MDTRDASCILTKDISNYNRSQPGNASQYLYLTAAQTNLSFVGPLTTSTNKKFGKLVQFHRAIFQLRFLWFSRKVFYTNHVTNTADDLTKFEGFRTQAWSFN